MLFCFIQLTMAEVEPMGRSNGTQIQATMKNFLENRIALPPAAKSTFHCKPSCRGWMTCPGTPQMVFLQLNKRIELGGLELQESVRVPLRPSGIELTLSKKPFQTGPLCGRALRGPVHSFPGQLLTVTCICFRDSKEFGH